MNESRSEVVKCVADPKTKVVSVRKYLPPIGETCVKYRNSLCGRYVWYEFVFIDWEHADLSVKNDCLEVCPDCLAKREQTN